MKRTFQIALLIDDQATFQIARSFDTSCQIEMYIRDELEEIVFFRVRNIIKNQIVAANMTLHQQKGR